MRSSRDPKFFSLTRKGKEELESKLFLFGFVTWKFIYYFCSHPISQNLFTCPYLYPRKTRENVSMCASKTSSKRRKERKHSRRIINSLWNQWMACPTLHGDKKVFPKPNRYTYTNVSLCVT